MRHRLHFLLVAIGVAIGCSSTPQEPPRKTASTHLLELKIHSSIERRITVEQDGSIADATTGTTAFSASGKLSPDDLASLKKLAASVDWTTIPGTGFTTADGKPVAGGREYDLTYYGTSPSRIVHSMDGAAEVASFTRLRDTVELYGNKIGGK